MPRGEGKLAEYPHDQTGPLFRGSNQFNYSGIIARFLPLAAHFHHINLAWLFGPDGHVDDNDFAQVILLRGALVRALQQEGTLTLDRLGPAIFKALKPSPQDFMKSPVPSGPGYEEAKRAMVDLLDNLILEDLARAWRIAQPNLEQCGLVRINYAGLDELALDEERWAHAPVISEVDGKKRLEILRAVLDHLRGVLAIDAGILEEDHTRSLVTSEEEERTRGGNWPFSIWSSASVGQQSRINRAKSS